MASKSTDGPPRSACGEVLDTLESEHYKIIVDDALKWLATYKYVRGGVSCGGAVWEGLSDAWGWRHHSSLVPSCVAGRRSDSLT